MDALSAEEYLEKNNKLLVAPGCAYETDSETTEIKEIRDACKAVIVRYSWDMIFAEDEEEFEYYKEEMKRLCMGLGYSQVYEYDLTGARQLGSLRAAYY